MNTDDHFSQQRIFRCFADMLDYPRAGLAEAARECERLVSTQNSEAAAFLREYGAWAAGTPQGKLEEAYTAAFDLGGITPYVGYHLLGESYKRSIFLLELRKRYRACGLDIGSELPDHVAPLLRYLAVCGDAEERAEIVEHALLPALQRMTGKKGGEADAGLHHEFKHQPQRADEPAEEIPASAGVADDHNVYRKALWTLRMLAQEWLRLNGGENDV